MKNKKTNADKFIERLIKRDTPIETIWMWMELLEIKANLGVILDALSKIMIDGGMATPEEFKTTVILKKEQHYEYSAKRALKRLSVSENSFPNILKEIRKLHGKN